MHTSKSSSSPDFSALCTDCAALCITLLAASVAASCTFEAIFWEDFRHIGGGTFMPEKTFGNLVKLMPQSRAASPIRAESSFWRVSPMFDECGALATSPHDGHSTIKPRSAPLPLSFSSRQDPAHSGHSKAPTKALAQETSSKR
uniref:Secreted protein n=1 Tax=Ixodes ricinus TaxID=34613 RepID=A0A6B0UU14_IXORI